MDAGDIAVITGLSVDKVSSVMKRYNNDEGKVKRELELYLDHKSGAFREVAQGGPFKESADGFAEISKQRRPKKVRHAHC